MFLTDAEIRAVEAAVARLEARTGIQAATAVVGKSDTYAELPWKAFALGASFAAFALVAADAWSQEWSSGPPVVDAIGVLGAGLACALLAIFVRPFARLFLRAHRAEHEVARHAREIFLERQLFKTRDRTAVLILISLFERRIEIVADVGLRDRLSESDWHGVIGRMAPHMRNASPGRALEEGVGAVEALLVSKGVVAAGPAANELSDRPIEERGA